MISRRHTLSNGSFASYSPGAADSDASQTRTQRTIPNSLQNEPPITVQIRQSTGETKSFRIPKSFICSYSEYFETASVTFRESGIQELELQDVSIEVFEMFLTWHTKQVLFTDTSRWPSCSTLIDLWLFANRIQSTRLQALAFTYLDYARAHRRHLSKERIQWVWNNTREGSPLRRYVLDIWNIEYATKEHHLPQQYPFDSAQANGQERSFAVEMSVDDEPVHSILGRSGASKRKGLADPEVLEDADNMVHELQNSPARAIKRARMQTVC